MLEPVGRNTAPAILAATLQIMKEDKEALILASPADHLIPNKEEFNKAINKAFDAISLGKIITFGVVPTRVETGYGYLQVGRKTMVNIRGKIIC